MNTNLENDQPRAVVYLLLLAAQVIGAIFLMWNASPTFGQLVLYPGDQPRSRPYEDASTIGTLLVMQAAYWYRLLRIPIPFQGSSLVLNHLFLFLGRLSFIFGGALFTVVFFRHLPALDPDINILLMARRGLVLVGTLFALFCVTLELERLGHAIGSNRRDSANRHPR
jgi:hypothetical protein